MKPQKKENASFQRLTSKLNLKEGDNYKQKQPDWKDNQLEQEYNLLK